MAGNRWLRKKFPDQWKRFTVWLKWLITKDFRIISKQDIYTYHWLCMFNSVRYTGWIKNKNSSISWRPPWSWKYRCSTWWNLLPMTLVNIPLIIQSNLSFLGSNSSKSLTPVALRFQYNIRNSSHNPSLWNSIGCYFFYSCKMQSSLRKMPPCWLQSGKTPRSAYIWPRIGSKLKKIKRTKLNSLFISDDKFKLKKLIR